MGHSTTARQRIGAGFLAMLMLALLGAGLLTDCPPGCCEAGELSIARKMECCETPTMTERSPASSEPAITVRIVPQVLLQDPRHIQAQPLDQRVGGRVGGGKGARGRGLLAHGDRFGRGEGERYDNPVAAFYDGCTKRTRLPRHQ